MIKVKFNIKRIFRKLISPIRRIGLKNSNFSIISNNCWGGIVYDIFGFQYKSPTIGCYFPSEDFLKFCMNLKYYLSLELEEVKNDEKIIGKLDDIIVYFVHYGSFSEAYEKWNRRKKRINFDNILIKYSDQNGFEESHYKDFLKLEYNKIFITCNSKFKDDENVIFIKEYENDEYVIDDIRPSLKKINLVKMINGMKK